MYQEYSINLLKFLLSFADILDLVSQRLSQHQIRTAYIAYKIGELVKLSNRESTEIVYAGLLHDIGALTSEEKIDLHESRFKNIQAHCIRGEKVLNRFPLFKVPAKIIRYHHTSLGDLNPYGKNRIFFKAQILNLADNIERSIERDKYILFQNKKIIAHVVALAGTEIDPVLIDAFRILADKEEFWFDIVSPKLSDLIQIMLEHKDTSIQQASLTALSETIRDIIDFKSRFTATHSTGVAVTAEFLGKALEYTEIETEMLKIAGNLHDIGKLTVPNAILEKENDLRDDEIGLIRQHPYYTYYVLHRSDFPKHVIEWASFHHEKLNGSGYPFHIGSKKLDMGARIIAIADIFTALIEDRPYRKGMGKQEALEVLSAGGKKDAIDKKLVEVVKKHYDEIHAMTLDKQALEKEYYERTL